MLDTWNHEVFAPRLGSPAVCLRCRTCLEADEPCDLCGSAPRVLLAATGRELDRFEATALPPRLQMPRLGPVARVGHVALAGFLFLIALLGLGWTLAPTPFGPPLLLAAWPGVHVLRDAIAGRRRGIAWWRKRQERLARAAAAPALAAPPVRLLPAPGVEVAPGRIVEAAGPALLVEVLRPDAAEQGSPVAALFSWSEGFTVQLDDGRRVHVPRGRVRLEGGLTHAAFAGDVPVTPGGPSLNRWHLRLGEGTRVRLKGPFMRGAEDAYRQQAAALVPEGVPVVFLDD